MPLEPDPGPESSSLPALLPATTPSPRGGRRPGAGAPRGNVNALKHGRRSRFADHIPAPLPSTIAVARRLLARERREVERHAQTLLRVARFARYHRDRAISIEQGLPLPYPPLDDIADVLNDFAALAAYVRLVGQRDQQERARAAGLLSPERGDHLPDLQRAQHLECLVRGVAGLLDTITAAIPAPAALAALLTDNQSAQPATTAPSEATRDTQSNVAASRRVHRRRSKQSTSDAKLKGAAPSPTVCLPRNQNVTGESPCNASPCSPVAETPRA